MDKLQERLNQSFAIDASMLDSENSLMTMGEAQLKSYGKSPCETAYNEIRKYQLLWTRHR
jgi:hypothetical protein